MRIGRANNSVTSAGGCIAHLARGARGINPTGARAVADLQRVARALLLRVGRANDSVASAGSYVTDLARGASFGVNPAGTVSVAGLQGVTGAPHVGVCGADYGIASAGGGIAVLTAGATCWVYPGGARAVAGLQGIARALERASSADNSVTGASGGITRLASVAIDLIPTRAAAVAFLQQIAGTLVLIDSASGRVARGTHRGACCGIANLTRWTGVVDIQVVHARVPSSTNRTRAGALEVR